MLLMFSFLTITEKHQTTIDIITVDRYNVIEGKGDPYDSSAEAARKEYVHLSARKGEPRSVCHGE